MDVKNVRVLKPYEDSNDSEPTIYIDEEARFALAVQWGEKVEVVGRRKCEAIVKALKEIDCGVQIARVNAALLQAAKVELGEEVLLQNE